MTIDRDVRYPCQLKRVNCLCRQFVRQAQEPLHTIHASQEENIYLQGEPASAVYILCTGAVIVLRRISSGQERLLYTVKPGECFGSSLLRGVHTHDNSALAVTPCYLRWIDKNSLTTYCREYSCLKSHIAFHIAQKQHELTQSIMISTFGGSQEKVAHLINTLAGNFGLPCSRGYIKIPWSITQAWMSQLLGLRRETVSRALKKLHRKQLIDWEHRQFTVLSSTGLRDIFNHVI